MQKSGKKKTPVTRPEPLSDESVNDYREQILASLNSGVVALDKDGYIVTANPYAFTCLCSGEEAPTPGTRFEDLTLAAPFADLLHEIEETGRPVSRRELFLVREDGVQMEIGLSASLLTGPDEYNGVILLFTDMTGRRNLERAAEFNRQLAQIGELTAGVVHELRNPLSVVSGMAELLMRRLESDPDNHKRAKTIFEEAGRLDKSINQFLGFAKPFELNLAACSAGDIIARAVQLCQRQAEKSGVSLRHECPSDLPEMRADKSKAAQVIANIISNGIDAVPEDGEVIVSARADGSDIVFEVADNGPGIHLSPDENLFDPFFTKKEDGTGLGLAIAQRIVASHTGSITFSNCAEGGVIFEVRLPVTKT